MRRSRCCDKFAAFPEIQVIDLDAAMGRGSNDDLVELLAARAVDRVGGGVRSVERAQALVEQGAHSVIVGTAAFHVDGVNEASCEQSRTRSAQSGSSSRSIPRTAGSSSRAGAKRRSSPPKKCSASWSLTARGFLCTYVDKEGMMQGTDLDWFRRLRAATRARNHRRRRHHDSRRRPRAAGHERPRRARHGDLHRPAESGRACRTDVDPGILA